MRRRALLEHLLEEYGIGPPIQAVPTTTDVDLARVWYDALRGQGVEGLMIKVGSSPYRGGSRQWRKLRHAETVDATVVGFTGSAGRPRQLVVRLPGGIVALSQSLKAPLAAQMAQLLAGAGRPGKGRLHGEPYTVAASDVVVEVLAGTTRHAVVTVTRAK